jgi:FkbM family methyltransferase
MKRLAKRLVLGTRWEAPIRRAHHAVTRSRNSLYDAQTIAIMGRVLRPDSNAVDVGAFEGGMLRHMIRMAPRGRHVAFEPLPDHYAALAARFTQVRVHGCALGEAPGEADYVRVTQFPALSGLTRRPDLGGRATETIRVRVETMDRMIPRDHPVSLIKVDVEGGELGVFRGARETLQRNRPIVVFECGLAAAGAGATPDAIHEALAEGGLTVSTLQSWLAGSAPLSREEFRNSVLGGREFYFVAHP